MLLELELVEVEEGLVEVPDDDDEADLPVLGGTANASILRGREGKEC